MEPVVGKEEDPYALQEADLPALKAEYERLAEYLRAKTAPIRIIKVWIPTKELVLMAY